jgi:hypothetical protein
VEDTFVHFKNRWLPSSSTRLQNRAPRPNCELMYHEASVPSSTVNKLSSLVVSIAPLTEEGTNADAGETSQAGQEWETKAQDQPRREPKPNKCYAGDSLTT